MSEYLKKSDDAGYNYVLKDVENFIPEIKSMEEKINLDLFEDFFESPSPAHYAKILVKTSPGENKKNSRGNKRQDIKFKRQNKKK